MTNPTSNLVAELRSNLRGGPAPALHDGVTGKAKCVICGNFNRFWHVISGCNFCQSCVSEALGSPVETSSDVSALLTVQQHNKRLRAALSAIAVGTPDLLPPFRIMGEAQLRAMARKALGEVPPVEPTAPITVAILHATTGMVQIGPERSPEKATASQKCEWGCHVHWSGWPTSHHPNCPVNGSEANKGE